MKPVLAIIIEMMIISCIFVLSGCSLTPQEKNASKSASAGPVNNAPLLHTGPNFSVGTPSTYGTPLFTYRNSSDPHSYVFNGVLYLYTSCDLNGQGAPTYPMNTTYCYSTSDLINWTDNGAMVTESQLPWASQVNGMWAPCAAYKNGTYYLYVPEKINQDGSQMRIGVCTGSTPTGTFAPPQNYMTIPTVANAPQGDFNSDPYVFIDTGGTPYMLYCDGNNPQGRVCIVQMDNMTTITKTPVTIDSRITGGNPPQNQFEEGARLILTNGTYYLYYPASVNSVNEYLVYATSTTGPMGPYTYKGQFMKANQGEWTIQGDIVNYDNKWVLFYHDTPMTPQYARMVCAEYFNFNSDYSIPQINRTVQGLTVDPTNQIQAATYFSQAGGLQTEATSDPGSTLDVGFIQNGSYCYYSGINFMANNGTGLTGFTARVASATSGGYIKIYQYDPSSGILLGTVSVPGTGGWQNWVTVSCSFVNPSPGPRMNQICLVFTGQSGYLFNIDRFQFSYNGGVTPGVYTIKNRNSGTVMDMPQPYTKGTQADIHSYLGYNNRQWIIQNSGPYITIQNNYTKFVLGVDADSTGQGARIIQWDANSKPSQQWTLVPVTGQGVSGYFYIQNVNSGMNIGCDGGKIADGTPLIQWPYDGSLNQQWSFQAP